MPIDPDLLLTFGSFLFVAGLLGLVLPGIGVPRAAAVAPIIASDVEADAGHLSSSAQIGKICDIITIAGERARSAERLHRAAHEQIDAAHYALQNLLNELSAVMPIQAPASPSSAPRVATLAATRRVAYETALAA
jgi:hypothetical protein